MLCFNKLTGEHNAKKYFTKCSFRGSISLTSVVIGVNETETKFVTIIKHDIPFKYLNKLMNKSKFSYYFSQTEH